MLKHVLARAQALENGGRRAIIVRPQKNRLAKPGVALTRATGQTYPNLFFQIPPNSHDLSTSFADARWNGSSFIVSLVTTRKCSRK